MALKTILARLGAYLLVPFLFLIVWGLAARQLDNEVILPGVGQVAELFLQPAESLIAMGSLATNVAISLVRVLAGYLLAVCLAVPLGIIMGYYGPAFRLLNGFLALFRPIPPLAWVPLVLAWFGVASLASLFNVQRGTAYLYLNNLKFSMIFIIFIGAFYPILTSSIHGVQNVRSTLLDSARVLGAGEGDIFRKILLPAALPSIVNGMRIGLGVASDVPRIGGDASGKSFRCGLPHHARLHARTDGHRDCRHDQHRRGRRFPGSLLPSHRGAQVRLDEVDAMKAGPILSIETLRKTFRTNNGGSLEALAEVSFDIPENDFVCIVGPSGCGKSTLLRMIAGLETITSGRIGYGERRFFGRKEKSGWSSGVLPSALEKRDGQRRPGPRIHRHAPGRARGKCDGVPAPCRDGALLAGLSA